MAFKFSAEDGANVGRVEFGYVLLNAVSFLFFFS